MALLGLPVHVPGDSEGSQFPGEELFSLHHRGFLLAPLARLFLGLSTFPRIHSTLTTESISFASCQYPYKLPRTIRVGPRV